MNIGFEKRQTANQNHDDLVLKWQADSENVKSKRGVFEDKKKKSQNTKKMIMVPLSSFACSSHQDGNDGGNCLGTGELLRSATETQRNDLLLV